MIQFDLIHYSFFTFYIISGRSMNENILWREAFTFDDRKEELAKFFNCIIEDVSITDRLLNIYSQSGNI